jgi:FkbM family methyltransferase
LPWLRGRKDKHEDRLSRLERIVSTSGSESRELWELTRALKVDQDAGAGKVSALQTEHDKLVERVAALRAEHEQLAHQNITGRLSALQTEHDKLVERVAVLRKEHDQIERQMSLLSSASGGRTLKELHEENEKNALGLQYTIGERERLKALFHMVGEMLKTENASNVSGIIQTLIATPSERYQDVFALLLSGGKRNGFFVEFGACDGLAVNNTLSLERNFDWRGILAEPDVFWHDRLSRNRTARIDKRCVSSVTGGQLEFYQSDRPGNSSSDKGHPYLGSVVQSYTVETVSFLDLLKDHDAPRFIDFLSVDTEGHEKEVFTNFDFEQYKFGFICIEQHEQLSPEDSVQPILEAAGYKVIFPRENGRPVPMQITGIDKFFVPKDYPWIASSVTIES